MLLEDKQLFKFGVVMTVIYMMFLVLFIVSLVLVLDQLQGKNLKKQSYLSKKSRIEENA
jgi:formate-dependent nitrite reductase membrane component NrfD